MKTRPIYRSARNMSWANKKALTLTEDKTWQAAKGSEDIKTLLSVWGFGQQDFEGLLWGWKIWQSPAHFISSPRPTTRKKKRLRMSKEGPSCWEAPPRTILSLANQGHWRGKQHTLKDNPPSRPKQKDQHNGIAMGAWWRSNFRRSCHLRIKFL